MVKRAIKRKRPVKPTTKFSKHKDEEEILSDDLNSDESDSESNLKKGGRLNLDDGPHVEEDESDSDGETPHDKRIRMSKAYLDEIALKVAEKQDLKEAQNEAIAHRLKDDAQERAGILQKKVADKLLPIDSSQSRILKGHSHTLTCIAVSSDSKFIYSASKDCSIIKWCFETGKKMIQIKGYVSKKDKKNPNFKPPIGHTTNIYALAISSNFKYLVSGCEKGLIIIWNPDTMEIIYTFKAHNQAVMGLVFRKNLNEFYSCSLDRRVKVWNAETQAFIQEMHGHTNGIVSIDTHTKETAITSGSLDQSFRFWKIQQESQLVFDYQLSFSVDCARFLNDQMFVGGSDNGTLSLWHTMKKKPFITFPQAHGVNPENNASNWITAVACLPNTDLIVSGSNNGGINIWKCETETKDRKLHLLQTIPIVGFVNDLRLTQKGDFLIAAVSKDHKFGRWFDKIEEARNSVVIYPIAFNE